MQLKICCVSCMRKMSCSLTQTHIKLTVFAFQNNAAGGLAFGEFTGWKWKLHVQNAVETVSESFNFCNTIMVLIPQCVHLGGRKAPLVLKRCPLRCSHPQLFG